MERFPASGEINWTVSDSGTATRAVRDRYAPGAKRIGETDGISIEFDNWRSDHRPSNTHPVIRLNVENRGDNSLM